MTPAHELYNKNHYPTFVCHHGNWDIYRNATGNCAAIPTESSAAIGCKATHFGDIPYVRITLRKDLEAQGVSL